MPHVVTMPEVLAGTAEATILEWKVADGDVVEHGTVLAEIETEKATVELPSSGAGTVGRLLVEPGSPVAVGAPLVALLAAGETAKDVTDTPTSTPTPSTLAPSTPPSAAASVPGSSSDEPGGERERRTAGAIEEEPHRLFASPLARRLVRERGLDRSSIEGTGPAGRITRRDVERVSAAPTTRPSTVPTPVRPEPDVVPHSRARQTIARRLTEAKTTIPHFYLRARCQVDALLDLRRQLNAVSETRISVNDLVIRAVAVALREVPEANVRWSEEGTVRLPCYDVGVAVSAPDGLAVPVVRDVLDQPFGVMTREIGELVERARGATLRPEEMAGGSMTVSNLGMHGVSEFCAIINPPQCAILAVGAAEKQVVVEDDDPVVATVMTVTLSVDHRVLDGEPAARWLNAFVTAVERPVSLLL